METLELKSAPEVKRVILAAFPSYKKHRAFLSVSNGGHNINSYWDGGSRDEYAIVELATMQRKALPTRSHPYFDIAARGLTNAENEIVSVDHVGNLTLKVLPEGFALVSAGTFCGKPAPAHVFVNAANMAKLLTSARPSASQTDHAQHSQRYQTGCPDCLREAQEFTAKHGG